MSLVDSYPDGHSPGTPKHSKSIYLSYEHQCYYQNDAGKKLIYYPTH